MTHLLIPEPPLQLLPSLAKEIGLNEAIVLQQIHYWLMNKKIGKVENGRKWVRNTVEQWQEDNFPFWSTSTIRRTISSLEEMGIVLSDNLNKAAYDRTLWYSIDYEKLNHFSNWQNPFVHFDKMETANVNKPIPETTTETTQRNNIYEPAACDLNSEFQTALAHVSKERLAPGFNEKKFEDAAFALIGWEAELSDVAAFGEYWKVNGWHNEKPALTNIINHWQDYKDCKNLRKPKNHDQKNNGSIIENADGTRTVKARWKPS